MKLLPEKQVGIASKMYSARNSMRYLFADTYATRCKEWQEVIKRVAGGKKLSEIQAMIDIMKNLDGKEMAQMWIMAAYVEMVEPSSD